MVLTIKWPPLVGRHFIRENMVNKIIHKKIRELSDGYVCDLLLGIDHEPYVDMLENKNMVNDLVFRIETLLKEEKLC